MKKFSYQQATEYLDDCLIFGIKPSLIRINKILELQGNPHKKLDFIHVVGTNGKTSTTIITACIINSHGIRCGYHISPHINEYTERLWYCGNNITEKRFAKLLSDLWPFIEEVNALDLGGPITQFEIIAAMAFKLAYDEGLETMVLEAGLGGRWDATNVADSEVVGLTGVSLEHTSVLGRTIAEIADEKSQVIKNNALVATLSKDEKVLQVLKKQILATNSKLYLYGKDFYIESKEKMFLEGWKVNLRTIYDSYKNLVLPLIGNYQPENLLLSAVLSELYLNLKDKRISEKILREALLHIRVAGRFEILRKGPVIVADTSHNPEGIRNFIKNINENFRKNRKVVIFSVLKDKNYRKMLENIAKIADILILTSSNTLRSLPIDVLEKEYYKLWKKNDETQKKPAGVYKVDSILNSLNYALKIADSNDIICITGSITNLENII